MRTRVTSAVVLSMIATVTAIVLTGAVHDAGATDRRQCAFARLSELIECLRSYRTSEPARELGRLNVPHGTTLVYASAPYSEEVSISALGPKGLTPVGNLTFGDMLPLGLTVDNDEDLYVAVLPPTTHGQGAVDVFAPGATKPSRVYTQGLTQPIDVAVDSHGTLYVANFAFASGACSVVEYAKHSMKPTTIITGIPGCLNGVAVDASENLYVTYVAYPSGNLAQSDVLKYAPKSTKGVPLHLQAPGGNFFWGVAVTAKGDVVLANVQEVGTINQILTFPSGSKSPTNSTQYGLGWFPEYFALRGDRLFAPAFAVDAFPPGVAPSLVPAVFDYPSGRELVVESPKLLAPAYFFGYAASH